MRWRALAGLDEVASMRALAACFASGQSSQDAEVRHRPGLASLGADQAGLAHLASLIMLAMDRLISLGCRARGKRLERLAITHKFAHLKVHRMT